MPLEICRKAGISLATYFKRRKHEVLSPTEMRWLKQVDEKNGKSRKLVAAVSLENEMLQDMIRRKLRCPGEVEARR